MAENERTVRGSVQDIISAYEKKEISYDQAKKYLMEFTKDGLSWFILNKHQPEEERNGSGITCS